jgi:hypothetical protein
MMAVRHPQLSSRTTLEKEVTTDRKINAYLTIPSTVDPPGTQRKFDSYHQSSSPVGHFP